MDAEGEGHAERGQGQAALDELLPAPSAILECVPEAVVVAAADGRIVFVNRLAEQLFGYSRDELLGRPAHILWPERLRGRYATTFHEYVTSEDRGDFTTRAWGLRRDGSEFVGEMSLGILPSR